MEFTRWRWSFPTFDSPRKSNSKVEDGEAWIARNGHKLADKLHDLGISAFRGRNRHVGALSKFLEAVKSGRVPKGSILLVENLDRLSRQSMTEAKKVFESILEAGVKIATLRPYERLFTEESVSDPFGLMEPLMAFHLAHIESKNKADRLRKLWEGKRLNAVRQGNGFRFDHRGPSWVRWDGKKNDFVLNDGAQAVKFIFELTAEGMGQRQVLGQLQKKFSPIGISRRWNTSFVQKVLNDRAVLGERQPKSGDENGKRQAVGPTIHGYYPAAVTEDLWARAQAAKTLNLKKKGPNGQFVNLFVGLIVNAHDGQPMHVQVSRAPREGKIYVQRRLVSYGHTSKIPGSDPISVAYFDLENVIINHLSEVRTGDLGSQTGVSELRAKEQAALGMEQRLKQIEVDLVSADPDEYEMLRNAANLARQKRKELQEEVRRLKAEMNADQPLGCCQSTLKMLADADEDQRHALRLRLRSLITELVESVVLKPEKHFGRVYTIAQINYRGGMIRQVGFGPGWVTTKSERVGTCCLPWGVDLRDKAKSQKPILQKIAAMLAQPAPAPTVNKIPDTVGEAAKLFLAVRKAEMSNASFRVVPAKILRFVQFAGATVATKEVTAQHWQLFIRWLKAEISDGRLARGTAKITFNRCREFVRWAMPSLDTKGSARKLLA